MIQDTAALCGNDQRLAGRIATLMRIGTASAAVLLSVGALLLYFQAGTATTVFLTGGCALLILLPVIRLVMMAVHFAQTNRPFAHVSALVLVLVLAGTVAGLWL